MAKPNPILKYRITDHAKQEMNRHHVSEANVATVLSTPKQSESVRIACRFIRTAPYDVANVDDQAAGVIYDIDVSQIRSYTMPIPTPLEEDAE